MNYTEELEQRITVEIEEEDGDACRLLWLSVILQNLSDALYKSDSYPFEQRRKDAREWIEAREGAASDLAMVCSLAGVDFQRTKQRLDLFVSGELKSIDFRCLRKGKCTDSIPESRSTYLGRKRRYEAKRDLKRGGAARMSSQSQDRLAGLQRAT